jgi:hypothetical protein
MDPLDPRHGTYAGYEAHKKGKTPYCQPCADAGYKARKRMRMRGPAWTNLGEDAYAIVCAVPPAALSRSTGLARRTLHRLKVDGPETSVRHDTKTKILRSRTVTPIGVARRLRALAALGWSARSVADQAGLTRWNVERARVAETRKYAHTEFAARIVAVYDELMMTPAPPSRSATWQLRIAKENAWPPPLAWIDIDNPDEQPTGLRDPTRTLDRTAERFDTLRDMDAAAVGVSEACRVLGVNRKSLQKWCERHEMYPLFSRMVARETAVFEYRNGATGAA